MAEELLINVNVNGEEDINKVSDNLTGVEKTSKKATNAMADFRREMRDAKGALLTLEEGTKEYNAALLKAASAADKMRDMTDKVKASQRDVGIVAKNVAGAISGLAGGFSAATGLVGLFGEVNEDTQKSILKVQSALAVASGFAQFADSIDSMKDLLGAAKLSFMQLIVSKEADTVATVENTVVNEAEAVAITSTGVAAQSTSKIMWSTLGVYALIAAAIGVVIYGLVKLIQKMNEVPKDVEFNLKMNEDISKGMTDTIVKVKQFAYDYNNAVRSGNKERIASLEEFGRKNFDLHKNQLKQIGENVDAWRVAFKSYIDMARLTYQQEYIIKNSAEADANVLSLSNQKKILKDALIKQANEDTNGLKQLRLDQIKKVENAVNKDEWISSANKLLRDYINTLEDYNEAVKKSSLADKTLLDFETKNAEQLKNIRSKSTPVTTVTTVEPTKDVKQFKDLYVEVDRTESEKALSNYKFNIDKLNEIYITEFEEKKKQADKLSIINDTIKMGETERILYQIKTIKENLPKLKESYNDTSKIYSNSVNKYIYDTEKLNDKIKDNNDTYQQDLLWLHNYEERKAILQTDLAKEQENFSNATTNSERKRINERIKILDKDIKANDYNLKTYKDKIEKLKETKAELEKEKTELDKTPDEIEKIKNKLVDINGQIVDANAQLIQSERDKWKSLTADVQSYLDALGSVTKGMTAIYKAQQTEIDSSVAGYEQVAAGASLSQSEIDRLKTKDAETYASAIAAKNGTDEDRAAFTYSLEQKAYEEKVKILEKQKKWEIASAWISFASGTVGIWSKAFTELGPIAGPIVASVETAGLLATTLSSIKTINSQRIDAPTPPSSGSNTASSTNASSQVYQSALNPTASTLTSNQENLNKMNNSSVSNAQYVVKVSEINKTQDKVKVQQNNSSF